MKISRFLNLRRLLKRRTASTSRLPSTRSTRPASKPRLMPVQISIEHGNEATDAQLKEMRDKDIFFDLTPTFYGGFLQKISEQIIVISAASRAEDAGSATRRKQQYDQLVERVLKSGVKFAAGSDMCWSYPGKTRGEASTEIFVNLRLAGMPSLDVIRAITCNAAEMLGWQDRIGTVEPESLLTSLPSVKIRSLMSPSSNAFDS
jgi:predicted amidohydrolase YtcJ